jgi:hypothetical protein
MEILDLIKEIKAMGGDTILYIIVGIYYLAKTGKLKDFFGKKEEPQADPENADKRDVEISLLKQKALCDNEYYAAMEKLRCEFNDDAVKRINDLKTFLIGARGAGA